MAIKGIFKKPSKVFKDSPKLKKVVVDLTIELIIELITAS